MKQYRYTIFHDGPAGSVTRLAPSDKWTLEQLQKAVGNGFIETLPRAIARELIGLSPGATVYVNEEGKYREDFQDNLHFNLTHMAGGRVWIDPVRGPAVMEELVNVKSKSELETVNG